MSSKQMEAGLPQGSTQPASRLVSTSSSDCVPAFTRQWSSMGSGDAPVDVQVRWLDDQIDFSTLGGSYRQPSAIPVTHPSHGDPPARSGMEAVRALPPKGGSSTGLANPDSCSVIRLPCPFTFTCTTCNCSLVASSPAATKSMLVECSSCHSVMSPQFPDAAPSQPATSMFRRATPSIGKRSSCGRTRVETSIEDSRTDASIGNVGIYESTCNSNAAHLPVGEKKHIHRSNSFGRAFGALGKAFGFDQSPSKPATDSNNGLGARMSVGVIRHPTSKAQGFLFPVVSALPPEATVSPLGSRFAPPSPPPTPPAAAEGADGVPEKSPRASKALANFTRAASFSKAFASKSKSKSKASRSATAPRGAVAAEVAKGANEAASKSGDNGTDAPCVFETGAGTAPAKSLSTAMSAGHKRAATFGRKTPPRRSHCSTGSAESGRAKDDIKCDLATDGKPIKDTPRYGDFEEFGSESSDEFSEDEGPMPGQPVDDISGRLSGGDFVFSL